MTGFLGIVPEFLGTDGLVAEDFEDEDLSDGPSFTDQSLEQGMPGASAYKMNTRPNWTIEGGTTPSYPSAGVLRLDPGEGIYEDQRAPSLDWSKSLTWEYRARNTANDYDHAFQFSPGTYQDSNNFFFHWGPNYRLPSEGPRNQNRWQKYVNGTGTAIINTYHGTDTNYHIMRGEYDGSGNYEIFYDGASDGTGSDSFQPTPNRTRLWVGSGGNIDHSTDIDWFTVW